MTMTRKHENAGVSWQVTAVTPTGQMTTRTVSGRAVRSMERNGFKLVAVKAVPENYPSEF